MAALWILLGLGLMSADAFFLDPDQPIVFQDGDRSFGHQVVQLGKWVMVSAPSQLDTANKTGRIYRCDPRTAHCSPVTVTGSGGDMKMSLGLAMAAQQDPPLLIVCGPTLQRICGHNIYVNGRCYKLDMDLRSRGHLPASLPECPGLDVVFLIDGSASIGSDNFSIMLDFVSEVISSFSLADTQFALIQYSNKMETHFPFRRFSGLRDLSLVTSITYQGGQATKTATGIRKAIEELFVPEQKSREKSQQLLIVITDGKSNLDQNVTLKDVASEADRLGIRRIAIGIGDIFTDREVHKELKSIASSPDHVLKVTNFSALRHIQKTLQKKIFAIEGTQLQDASSFQMEFSQDGFSVDLTPDGLILGAVGAYDWSGGASLYRTGQQNATWINETKGQADVSDSYLGYSVLRVGDGLIAIGAPRHRHTGRVLIYERDPKTSEWKQKAAAYGELIGSYFGSVMGTTRLSSSHIVLAVGAPTYYSPDGSGGRVYLCPIVTQDTKSPSSGERFTMTCPETLQGDPGQPVGHFGSAISVLPDLTGDGFPELVVGAPCEDNHQGAIYIFLGQAGGFRTSYSQRVAGRLLGGSLRFFGRSLSGGVDVTQDGLPDVAVGGEGRAFVFRSRAVLSVSATMNFHPREIPLSTYSCSHMAGVQEATNITLCFTQTPRNTLTSAGVSPQVNYTLLLDAGHQVARALFQHRPDDRSASQSLKLSRTASCATHTILLPGCVENSLSPLRVSLTFSLTGPAVLSEDSRSSHSAEVSFEKNCGGDGVCEDDLKVNITFPGVTLLVVGESLTVSVSVLVKNDGDDSYNARVLLPFPSGLSYRRVVVTESYRKVTVFCSTTEDQRVVTCEVNRPLLRANTMVIFTVSFHVSPKADLGDTLTLTASVASDNRGSHDHKMAASCQLRVVYAIYVTITSLESSSKYENFSGGDSAIQHVYKVINVGERAIAVSAIFQLPVRLGEATVWKNINISSSQPLVAKCSLTGDTAGESQELQSPVLDCRVGHCLRVECHLKDLEAQSSIILTVSGVVTREWSTQTEVKKISLQSSASIIYNSRAFYQNQRLPRAQVRTVLEIPAEYSYIAVIISSSVGGLLLLGLISAALYMLGFFRRQYQELLLNPGGDPEHEGPPETSTDPQ